MFALFSVMRAPAVVLMEPMTRSKVPVMSELMVRPELEPLCRNSSEPAVVSWPRVEALVVAPRMRAAASVPLMRPPLASDRVFVPEAAKETVTAAPFRVSELIVWLPEMAVGLAARRTLSVAPAPGRVCSCCTPFT